MHKPLHRMIVGIAALLLTQGAIAALPITTDSRIKTLVYNPNEVYNITTHYGYQSNIEFGLKETIETISMGDRVAWQISPAGRRLFIRAQEENAHTNMTVVTNLRAYQFDLRSSSADAVFGSEELTYVVRFFYPDDVASGAPMPVAAAITLPAPMTAPPVTQPAAAPVASLFNYRYTYSGTGVLAPLKVFDDGKATYFKFSGPVTPTVSVLTARGEMLDIATRRTADGLIAVDAVAPRLSLRQSGEQVFVYNESPGVL